MKMTLAAALAALSLAACAPSGVQDPAARLQVRTVPLPHTVLKVLPNGVEVRNGGFGSGMTAHPVLPDHFYTLTDRGPNTDHLGAGGAGKVFPVPEFTPQIALFRLTPEGVEQVKTIPLRSREGCLISGLPNADFGATGEAPYGLDGSVLTYDPDGLDPEGIAAAPDGTFWVSDEYGPHIVQFNADGVEIGRINPYPADARNLWTLPAEFANRRPNRGMEGLALTPDGRTLVGVMQSALENPRAARNIDLTRIVTIDIATGDVAQYLYRQDDRDLSNSEIAALADQAFLVVERDGGFLGDGSAARKNLYRIDLESGTDIASPALAATSHRLSYDLATGLLVDGQTLEQVIAEATDLDAGWERLAAVGIVPVEKALVLDALRGLNFPHDKLEGLWVMGPRRIGIINDDDFAVIPAPQGRLAQKMQPGGPIDSTILYVIDLPQDLY